MKPVVNAQSRLPFVTIAMPCLDEERHIERCLHSVVAQDYPRDKFEIIVADGGSKDDTRAILDRLSRRDPRIRVIDNPDRIQAAGMNRAIREARGSVIVRMDVHCEYAHDYVSTCVRVLAETGAANVGGAQRPRAETPFQRALAAALASPLGVGGARYRRADAEGDVDTVFLGAFDRRIFEVAGLYDPQAVTNEDAELNARIVRAGGRVYLSRAIEVYYYPRRSRRELARQYFRYGAGRARTLLKHRRLPALRSLAPFALVTAGSGSLLVPPLWPGASAFALFYSLVAGAEAARVARRLGIVGIAKTWSIFPVMHIAHGSGFAAGLCRYALRPDWDPDEERLEPASKHAIGHPARERDRDGERASSVS